MNLCQSQCEQVDQNGPALFHTGIQDSGSWVILVSSACNFWDYNC